MDQSKKSFDINSDPINLLVPAYFYPGAEWDRLINKSSGIPGRIYIIANPDNGPGLKKDKNYETAIDKFREKGGKVLGYVYTQYSRRRFKEVKKDFKRWCSFYNIDGFFLDEQSSIQGEEKYYQDLYDEIKSENSDLAVFANPGTVTQENYLYNNRERITDVICLFENEPEHGEFLKWLPPSWIYNYQRNNFSVLLHSIMQHNPDKMNYKQYVDYAKSKNIGWIYITDQTMPNPWSKLPDFFESMCDYIA
ncbi:MAG: spherulation-specific family 4 protein [Spirochaetes bacterium]|nr:spherulation-specific family 4 protein [Spirochaetota bacterium]